MRRPAREEAGLFARSAEISEYRELAAKRSGEAAKVRRSAECSGGTSRHFLPKRPEQIAGGDARRGQPSARLQTNGAERRSVRSGQRSGSGATGFPENRMGTAKADL